MASNALCLFGGNPPFFYFLYPPLRLHRAIVRGTDRRAATWNGHHEDAVRLMNIVQRNGPDPKNTTVLDHHHVVGTGLGT